MTVQRWVADISKDAETQFSEIFNKCVYYSLVVNESKDITSIAKMCILAHGITFDFEVFEELADVHSVQGQTNEVDFF